MKNKLLMLLSDILADWSGALFVAAGGLINPEDMVDGQAEGTGPGPTGDGGAATDTGGTTGA